MKTIEGKCGIKATVIADSVSEVGVRLTTFEIEYPRLILAELNTHRMLSKNSASSRAIPFAKMQEQLTARPVRFGANQAGMQDVGTNFDQQISVKSPDGEYYNFTAEEVWEMAKVDASFYAKTFHEAGFHKQICNRLTEPFSVMKTVISGTEWANFFWLRDDDAADPTIAELARCMREAREQSVPQLLKAGQWHLPYINSDFSEWPLGSFGSYPEKPSPYSIEVGTEDGITIRQLLTLEQAIKVSCARCAAVSYRGEDYGLEKCLQLYERLVGSEKKHASALEHCATPMEKYREGYTSSGDVNLPEYPESWEDGVSQADREGNLWSGNYKGFIQYRKLIAGECYNG